MADRREQLRDDLVAAAERAIETGGLEAVKARALATEVGCAVGAIYNAFPDLDALVLRVNLRTLSLFEAHVDLSDAAVAESGAGADRAVAELVRLGEAYLAFARAHPLRWRALFRHRMSEGRTPPDWYVGEQVRLFRFIEAPLGVLRPDLSADELHLLARTFFSATHGVVSLGLDEKLLALAAPVLDEQVAALIRAAARGLAGHRPAPGASS